MADILTRDQIRHFLIVFCFYDFDGDCKIETTDLRQVLRDLNRNPSEAELQELIDDADPDDTGYIDFREFLFLMARIVEEEQNEALRQQQALEKERAKEQDRRSG